MNRMVTLHRWALILLVTAWGIPAVAFDKEDYKAYVKEVRQQVWSQDLPEFKQTKCPDKYKGESAVILAAYDRLIVDQKKKIRNGGDLLFGWYSVRELNVERLNRQLVYINDEASLKEYSEFDYQTFKRSYVYGLGKEEMRNVLGVRIIKPDGTVNEVGTDDFVEADEGKKGKDKKEKLAVPGLAVGDIVDVFTFSMQKMKEENIPNSYFYYGGAYPMLSYRIHCEIAPKLTVQYRQLNGAPDFTASTNEDQAVVLDLKTENLQKRTATLWFEPTRQIPLTIMVVRSKKIGYVPQSVEDKGLQANPNFENILKDDWEYWKYLKKNYKYPLDKAVLKTARKLSTDEAKADHYYNYMLLKRNMYHDQYNVQEHFVSYLCAALQKMKVPFTRGITTTVDNEPIDQLISYVNTIWFVQLKSGKTYFFPQYPMRPGEIPVACQGQKAMINDDPEHPFTKGSYRMITLPISNFADNATKIDIAARIDRNTLHIDRTTSLAGVAKDPAARVMPTSSEVELEMMPPYGGKLSFTDHGDKKSKQYWEERRQKEEKERYDTMKDEIEEYHGSGAKTTGDMKVERVGMTREHSDMVYTQSYDMDGYVKRAGANLIVSVGRLVPDQLKVEGNDRKRSADIYRAAPSSMTVSIDLTVPDGYQVSEESVEKLNRYVDNASMKLKSVAKTTGNKLHVSFEKVYKRQQDSASSWPQMLKVIDAASDFNSAQILLRKR